ncbi:MAG: hypothetical protein FJ102_14500, partial [Deltaproteobacteria bacterium]|nr:hypothetical protein [Deltaproteobacteria bacterium]
GPLLFLGEVDVDPLHYLGFLAAYVVISNLFTPSYDASDLGWGGGTIDNPFSHTDDQNRFLRNLAFFLFPGKLVWWTLRLTWAAIGRAGR